MQEKGGNRVTPKTLAPSLKNFLSKQSLSNPRPAFSCDEWKRRECSTGQDATTHSSSSISLFSLAPATCERTLTLPWRACCQAFIQSQSPWRRDTQVHWLHLHPAPGHTWSSLAPFCVCLCVVARVSLQCVVNQIVHQPHRLVVFKK